MARAYESVLNRYAQGQRDAAFTALSELENRQVEAGAADSLLAAELQVIATLSRRDPQALPALVLLHHDAFQRYRRAHKLRLAAHALKVVVETAASAEIRSAGMTVRRVTGLAMTSMAGTAVDLNPPDAVELLRRATDLDPSEGHALLALGAIYEKFGRYGEAVDVLKRRVTIDATPEARLRLAVNLQRTGDSQAAESSYAALTGEHEEWVAILASQELATLLGEQGRTGEAVERLRAAVRRHPAERLLHLQLAFWLDRAGDRAGALAEAEAAALDLPAEADAKATMAPRRMYNRWPQDAFTEAEALMRQTAEPQLPRLAVALGTVSGTGG